MPPTGSPGSGGGCGPPLRASRPTTRRHERGRRPTRPPGATAPEPRSAPAATTRTGYLTTLHDDSVPLPPGAEAELSPDNPRLAELRAALRRARPARAERLALEPGGRGRLPRPALVPRRDADHVALPRAAADQRAQVLRLLALRARARRAGPARTCSTRTARSGAGRSATRATGRVQPRPARVGQRARASWSAQLELSEARRVLGARHRRRLRAPGAPHDGSAFPNLRDYCCVDAIPESTFVSEYYLRHRGCAPPARVVRARRGRRASSQPGAFDLAVNIHSFSECTLDAVEWWVALLRRLEVPRLLVVPNEPDRAADARGGRQPARLRAAARASGLPAAPPRAGDRRPGRRASSSELSDHFHLFALEP